MGATLHMKGNYLNDLINEINSYKGNSIIKVGAYFMLNLSR